MDLIAGSKVIFLIGSEKRVSKLEYPCYRVLKNPIIPSDEVMVVKKRVQNDELIWNVLPLLGIT